MKIRAAVLTECGRSKPYAESAPIEIRELDLAEPGQDMVRVAIEAASLCHSDLSVVNGSRARPTPMVLGHEASGRVLDVGPGVEGYASGDRVAFTFQPHCGVCDLCISSGGIRCRPAFQANTDGLLINGQSLLSDGERSYHHHTGVSGFAEATVVHHSSLIKVDDDIPYEVAALLGCAVLTGGGAVKNAAELAPGERVAVVGAGGVGLAAILVAQALGAESVDVVDPAEHKHEFLRSLGAAQTYLPAEAPLDSYDVVIEAAGVGPALESAVKMLKPGGRAVSIGLPAETVTAQIGVLDLVFKSKRIIGSYHGSGRAAEDLPVYADLWRQGKLALEKLVTRSITLSELNYALDGLDQAAEFRQIIRLR